MLLVMQKTCIIVERTRAGDRLHRHKSRDDIIDTATMHDEDVQNLIDKGIAVEAAPIVYEAYERMLADKAAQAKRQELDYSLPRGGARNAFALSTSDHVEARAPAFAPPGAGLASQRG